MAATVHEQNNCLRVETGLTTTTATGKMDVVQSRLLHPRQDFRYTVGNEHLLRATANRQETQFPFDVNNGPKPQSCSIVRIAGTQYFRIEFAIEVAVVLCGGLTPPDDPFETQQLTSGDILNNRWSVEETRDNNLRTVRVFEGALRVSHIEHVPSTLRYLVVPPLQKGYKRLSQRFVQSRDGLQLNYQITDRQEHAAPPYPATDWKCSHTESTGVGGVLGVVNLNIHLIGAPGVEKERLLAAAGQVLTSRVGDLSQQWVVGQDQDNSSIWIEQASFVDKVTEPEVILDVTLRRVKLPTDTNFFKMVTDNLTLPLKDPANPTNPIAGYDPEVWPVPSPYSEATLGAVFASYVQNPCFLLHGAPRESGGNSNQGEIVVGDDEDRVTSAEDDMYTAPDNMLPNNLPTGHNIAHASSNPYTDVELYSHYECDDGLIHLPYADLGALGPTAVGIPMYPPYVRYQFYYKASRMGSYPVLPNPLPKFTDVNGRLMELLKHDVVTEPAEMSSDASRKIYKGEAKMVYGMSRAPDATSKLQSGSSPVDSTTVPDNYVDGTKFQQGIMTDPSIPLPP